MFLLPFFPGGQSRAFQRQNQLEPLVPREEYIHRAPYGAAEGLGLHGIDHAQQNTLQQF